MEGVCANHLDAKSGPQVGKELPSISGECPKCRELVGFVTTKQGGSETPKLEIQAAL